MFKTQRSKSYRKVWLIVLAVVLAVVIALTIFFVGSNRENKDYRNPDTYVGLSENEAIRRAVAGGLQYDVIEQGSNVGVISGFDLILYVSDGEVVSAYYGGP